MDFNWELTVLGRAIAYPNLSGAAAHIGISQPQLSRIVARLESDLGTQLLDRSARRKSGWTPAAYRLAEVYSRGVRRLEDEIQRVTRRTEPSELRVGTLEGQIGIAQTLCRDLIDLPSLRVLELDVYDLDLLEEKFQKGELEVIFSFRLPGKGKPRYLREIGYQLLQKNTAPGPARVMSQFEFGSRSGGKATAREKIFVSNSLDVRKNWIGEFGGTGVIPSEVYRKKAPAGEHLPVYLIGAESLSPRVWEKIETFKG